jgi:hypothetical protein
MEGMTVQLFRRFRLWLFVLGLLVVAVGSTAAVTLSPDKPVDKCSAPLSHRTGGWTCYQPANTPTTPQAAVRKNHAHGVHDRHSQRIALSLGPLPLLPLS